MPFWVGNDIITEDFPLWFCRQLSGLAFLSHSFMHAEIHGGVHVQCSLLLSDLNYNKNVSMNFSKTPKHQIPWKCDSDTWKCDQTDTQTQSHFCNLQLWTHLRRYEQWHMWYIVHLSRSKIIIQPSCNNHCFTVLTDITRTWGKRSLLVTRNFVIYASCIVPLG